MNRKKIRVLLLVPRCTAAGPVFVLRDIVRYADRDAFSFTLFTLEEEYPERSILPDFTAVMPHALVPTSKLDALLGRAGRLKAEIDRLAPDVIHATGAIPDILISRLYPEKQLVILHSDFKRDYTYSEGLMLGLALAHLHLAAARRAGTAVAVAESLSEVYRREHSFDVPFIRNGVVLSPHSAYDKQALRARLGLPDKRPLFAYAASFTKRKNQEFLLRAFEEAAADGPFLVLLGDGPTYVRLRELYGNGKNCLLPGRVSNVRDYMRAVDYYVSASRSEGIGLATLEAMTEGLPLLLSDIPAHREIVGLAGASGELFRLDDGASFSEAMKLLIKRDYAEASAGSRETAARCFNAEEMSLAYQRLYRAIGKGR